MTDPYSVETFASGSASNLKLSPSFAQKSLCDCAVSTLTPRTTASACSNFARSRWRSEEHTSELQSLRHLVCRLLLEKKKKKKITKKTRKNKRKKEINRNRKKSE